MKKHILPILILLVHILAAQAQDDFDVRTYNLTDISAPWHPTKIQQDNRGMIWIGSWNGLYRYDGYTFQSFKPEPGQGIDIPTDRIRNMLKVGGDTLLCLLDERVYSFDVVSCRFDTVPEWMQESAHRRIVDNNRMIVPAATVSIGDRSFDNTQQHLIDNQGNHWLMSRENIHCISPRKRQGRQVRFGDETDLVRSLYRDSQGYYWLCTRDQQLVTLYDAQWNGVGYLGTDGHIHPQPTPLASIYCILDDGAGTIWLGSKPDGLFRLKRSHPAEATPAFTVQHVPEVPTQAVYDIQPDSYGCLWMASWGDGIICLSNPEADDPAIMSFTSLANACASYPAEANNVRRLTMLDDGTMMACTTRGLLVVDDIRQSFQQFSMRLHQREASRSASLTTSAVMAVTLDADRRLYVATESGGVNVASQQDLHAQQLDFSHITANDGLTSDVTFAFTEAPDGRILVLCPNGISAIDGDSLTVEGYGSQYWKSPVAFTECTPLIIGDSLLVLASEDGITTQPLHALTQQGFSPYIALTAVTIATEDTRYDMDGNDTIILAPTQRSLILAFAALDLRAGQNLQYRARLSSPQGRGQATWSQPFLTHEVMLQDLQPGTYTLDLRSSNADGQWPDNIRTISIVVQPTFLQSWYGQALLWLLFAALIAGITGTVMYIRRLNDKRRELLATYLALVEQTAQKTTVAAHAETTTGEKAEEPLPDEPIMTPPQHLTMAERNFLQRLMTFVEQNLSNSNVSLADMADATATSKSSLTRKTHQLLGVTPADFLKEARLKHASKLLRTTTQTLSEISAACGFSDPKYFSKCFKASTGKTPTEYRS